MLLATARWHRFLAVPPVTSGQSSPKCAKGGVKAGTFIPSRCLTG